MYDRTSVAHSKVNNSVKYNNKINVLFCNFIMDVFQNNGLPYNSDSVE